MKSDIASRFDQNIKRVENLVSIYEKKLGKSGKGRRGHAESDVLRAAVVLLHAATEDLLRSLAYWKLPSASSDVLAKIPLSSVSPAIKFTLGDLASHRGKSVDCVISDSVSASLERSNYNNTDEVAAFLSSIGVDVTKVNGEFSALDTLMSRRHQIVHRADRDETGGKGKHKVRSLGSSAVKRWIDAVKSFGKSLLGEIPA